MPTISPASESISIRIPVPSTSSNRIKLLEALSALPFASFVMASSSKGYEAVTKIGIYDAIYLRYSEGHKEKLSGGESVEVPLVIAILRIIFLDSKDQLEKILDEVTTVANKISEKEMKIQRESSSIYKSKVKKQTNSDHELFERDSLLFQLFSVDGFGNDDKVINWIKTKCMVLLKMNESVGPTNINDEQSRIFQLIQKYRHNEQLLVRYLLESITNLE